jgi:hypothetical protein
MFAIPLVFAIATVLLPRFDGAPVVTIHVADRYTGRPLEGANVAVDGQTVATGADGSVPLKLDHETASVTIGAPGYEAVRTTLTKTSPRQWQVALRPNVLSGRVSDADSGAQVAGVDVALMAADGSQRAATTDADGQFSFANVPEGATLRIASSDYGSYETPVGQQTTLDVSLKPAFVTGVVNDASGAPVAGARVAAVNGSAETTTGPDGAFHLSGGTDVDKVRVSAAGFGDQVVAVDAQRHVTAALDKEAIKSIYANLGVLSDPERWNTLIQIADTTEINAIVVDVKQDTIYYDTQVPFFRNIDGMVTPIFDPKELLAQLKQHGIYAIARMVVFKDPLVAEARPDLSVKDETTGQPWLDMNGTPWVNAFNQELWEANAELGAELAQLGFDEVQYDYIRFPSDGDLRTTDFGVDYTEANRRAAITGAVKLGSEKVRAAGAHFAVDLFPIVALMGDDQGIGQTLQDLEPLVDYVCLMIYPSHYTRGNIPVDGHPNDFPSETVTYTLQQSQQWAPDSMSKMRPWLQDFTYPEEGYSAYGPQQVREQIDAAEKMGTSGWMLWNAAGEFQVDALDSG